MTDMHPAVPEPEEQEPVPSAERRPADGAPLSAVPGGALRGAGEPVRLSPLLPRRQHPWLVVTVDDSAGSYGALVWALREAARREATVVAVAVLDEAEDDVLGSGSRPPRRTLAGAQERVEAQVLRAIAETGVHGRARTAVLERPIFDALTSAAGGADLVLVAPHGKTLLRPAVPRPPARRVARGA